jgi:hypothetical protein
MRLPVERRKHIEEMGEIAGFLRQSNISAKNLERLKILAGSVDAEVACLAEVVYQVAEICPHRRRRVRFLAKEHKNLFARLEELGLLGIMQP